VPASVRTIHFTWKDASPPEDIFPAWWRQSWEQTGWVSRLWSDDDILEFTASQSREVQTLMEAYRNGIARVDAFRYLLLKQCGGLYVDLDFVSLRPLDWLDALSRFSCADQGDGCLCNAFMWAPYPNDPFFDGIEEALLAYAGEGDPVSATGPRFLTAYAAGRNLEKIPTPWIYPVAWDDEETVGAVRGMDQAALREKYPRSRAIHLWSKSWNPECSRP